MMSRVCEICGKKVSVGNQYARRGLAIKKGGIGLKITGKTLRRFVPNLQAARVFNEGGGVVTIRVCAKCLKTGLRGGTILKAARGLHKRFLNEKTEQEAKKV